MQSDLDARAFRHALSLFRSAAKRIPAYKDFLKRARVKPENVRSKEDFEQIPLVDKVNYVSRYRLEEMSWDGSLAASKLISSSSGSTGVPFYWSRGRKQDASVGATFKRIYENVFDTRKGTTLCVDSFALGPWIAGLEFYNATKLVSDLGSKITIVTPSIERTIAVDEIRRLAGSFDRIVLAGYPPFVKDILELGAIEGIRWREHDVRLSTGGEAISERWRDRVATLLGKPDILTSVINMYGMAETGIAGFETPFSIALRRATGESSEIRKRLMHEGEVSALYQYDPMSRYFELARGNALVLTADAGLPLIRYDTRDVGGLFNYAEARHLARTIKKSAQRTTADAKIWQFPFVYLYGRRDLSISFYALNIYSENIKHALENSQFESHLSGLFTMSTESTDNLDQQFAITLELSRGTEPSARLSKALTHEVVESLCKFNIEYAKLFSAMGKRAKPVLTLVRYGQIQTIPGRKHKWVKRA